MGEFDSFDDFIGVGLEGEFPVEDDTLRQQILLEPFQAE